MSEPELVEWPELYCPFPSAISPHADQVNEGLIAWLTRHGLVTSEAHANKLRAAQFGRLAARAYPWASFEGLQLAADWSTWLFMRDDACDEAGLGYRPDAMRQHSAHLIATLMQGLAGTSERTPLILALSELRDRILRIAGPLWLARFVGPVEDYLEACAWEAANRHDRSIPSIATYKKMRLYTGGVLTCTSLIEVTDGIRLPLHLRRDPTLQRMIEIASNVICWSNDIFSVRKEIEENDFHNLAIVVRNALGCDWRQGMQCVAQMHDAEVVEFLRLERQLPKSPDGALEHFVAVLKAWMKGNFDWSLESGRYKPPAGADPNRSVNLTNRHSG